VEKCSSWEGPPKAQEGLTNRPGSGRLRWLADLVDFYLSRVVHELSKDDQEALARVSHEIFGESGTRESLDGLTAQQRVVVLVFGAQPNIDGGGFGRFFDERFSGQPSYSEFAAAYREIGADDFAEEIERGTALFGFDEPHLHPEKRREALEEYFDCDDGSPWDSLGEDCQSDVWQLLADYVRERFFSA
jgi:hypothetical protein